MGNVQNVNTREVGLSHLHLTANRGDMEAIRSLLMSTKSTNVDLQDKDPNTPLHYASIHGHTDVVNLLLSKGGHVNSRNALGQTSLHLAAKSGHASIVEILLDNHASVDVKTQCEETPFYLAAKNGHAEIVDLLLSRGIYDFVLTHRRETPLHVAVQNGHTEVVEVILKHSSGVSGTLTTNQRKVEENANGFTLIKTSGILEIQLSRSDERHVSAGLVWKEENEPLKMWRDSGGKTALDFAVQSCQSKMVKLLLNADHGRPTYSEKHLRQSFDQLIHSDINHMVTDPRNNSETAKDLSDDAQYRKFLENFKETAQELIKSSTFNVNHLGYGGQISDHLGYGGEAPLNDVVKFKQVYNESCKTIYLIHLLLEKGADFNLKNSDGETPLIIASERGCSDVIQTLFDWEHKSGIKLDLDARDQYGETALIKAAERNHVSVMRLLLNQKASVNLCDHYGFTPLHAAINEPDTNWLDSYFFCKGLLKQNVYVVNFLQTFSRGKLSLGGKTVDPQTVFGHLRTHLQYNERKNQLKEEAVKLLLDNDETNVNATDFRGNTPLDLALKSSKRIYSAILNATSNRCAIPEFQESEGEAAIEEARVDNKGRNPLHRMFISGVSDCSFKYEMSIEERIEHEKQFEFMINGILLNSKNFRQLATATDNKERNAVHYAAMLPYSYSFHKYRYPIRVAMKIGCQVNATDIYGKTPLHYAADSKKYYILVHCGADENMKDNFGNTPEDLMQLRVSEKKGRYQEKMDLYLSTDISQIFNTHHVTELNKRKLVETIRIHAQSPRPQESSEEAIWKIWTGNEFLRLNRRLSQLKPPVKRFIDRLADGIKVKDSRFECQPILIGSAEEETKSVISADFDFNFRLTKFSKLCDPFPHPLGPKGYFELKRKPGEDADGRNDEMFHSFFNKDRSLLTNEVNSRFQFILEEVLGNPDFWQHECLFDWNMKHIYKSRYRITYTSRYHGGLCKTVRLRMIHPIEDGEGGFLFVKISIDVVACVHVEDWWPEDPLPVGISPSVKTGGCTFVSVPSNPHDTSFLFSETYARISFASLESQIIKESSSLRKAAYIVCKVIFYHESGITYKLKTCLLFCMDPLNAKTGSETRNEDEITSKQLAFWVQRIMVFFMDFSRDSSYPCYFMPSFRRRALYPPGAFRQQLKRKASKAGQFPEDFSYSAVYGYYLYLCPDGSTFDIPLDH